MHQLNACYSSNCVWISWWLEYIIMQVNWLTLNGSFNKLYLLACFVQSTTKQFYLKQPKHMWSGIFFQYVPVYQMNLFSQTKLFFNLFLIYELGSYAWSVASSTRSSPASISFDLTLYNVSNKTIVVYQMTKHSSSTVLCWHQ